MVQLEFWMIKSNSHYTLKEHSFKVDIRDVLTPFRQLIAKS